VFGFVSTLSHCHNFIVTLPNLPGLDTISPDNAAHIGISLAFNNATNQFGANRRVLGPELVLNQN
jgi:hypothetical protein